MAKLIAFRTCLVRPLSVLNPEAVFKEKLGVWDPRLELTVTVTSPYLIIDYGGSFPLQSERSGMEKVSPIGWAHLYLSANNGTTNRKRRKWWKLALCLRTYILRRMGNPMPELTLNPPNLNTRKMTKNLGSDISANICNWTTK
jgi:hypothetical protein